MMKTQEPHTPRPGQGKRPQRDGVPAIADV